MFFIREQIKSGITSDSDGIRSLNKYQVLLAMLLVLTQGVIMASSTTTIIGVRIKNDDVAMIDALCEMSGIETRGEMVRQMIKPTFDMLVTAKETKSMMKATKARLVSEHEFTKIVRRVITSTEVQTEMFLDGSEALTT
jgi:hypothetical protein